MWVPRWLGVLAPLEFGLPHLKTRLLRIGHTLTDDELIEISATLRLLSGDQRRIEVARILCGYSARMFWGAHVTYTYSQSRGGGSQRIRVIKDKTLRRIKKAAETWELVSGHVDGTFFEERITTLPPSVSAVYGFKSNGIYIDIIGEMFRRELIDEDDLYFEE